MIIKTVVCDDNEKARYILRQYIKRLSIKEIELSEEAKNGYELIELCKKIKPDLILLDIDMPFINGIDTAKKIIKFLPDISLIFITAYPSFSLQAFEVHAVDFIVKPVSIERLEKSIKHIIRKTSKNGSGNNDLVTFVSNHNLYSIKQNDIIFAERSGRKTLIHTSSKKIEVYESIRNLQNRLSTKLFIRTHNSYLVNKSVISSIDRRSGGPHEVLFKNYDKTAYVSRKGLIKLDNM